MYFYMFCLKNVAKMGQNGMWKILFLEIDTNCHVSFVFFSVRQFSSSVDDNVPELIVGDSLRLGQVLLNLMSNSIKFTHR